jgi:hypothetical protein
MKVVFLFLFLGWTVVSAASEHVPRRPFESRLESYELLKTNTLTQVDAVVDSIIEEESKQFESHAQLEAEFKACSDIKCAQETKGKLHVSEIEWTSIRKQAELKLERYVMDFESSVAQLALDTYQYEFYKRLVSNPEVQVLLVSDRTNSNSPCSYREPSEVMNGGTQWAVNRYKTDHAICNFIRFDYKVTTGDKTKFISEVRLLAVRYTHTGGTIGSGNSGDFTKASDYRNQRNYLKRVIDRGFESLGVTGYWRGEHLLNTRNTIEEFLPEHSLKLCKFTPQANGEFGKANYIDVNNFHWDQNKFELSYAQVVSCPISVQNY